ncbi:MULTISPECIES: transporter substrate-binding domain-containing protein [Pseudomonas]|uniref:substrate-binding periplasmic protein n=2 Tax=Pseudomonas TaxID=286 RepID=UPI001C7E1D6A|nr:MULTISPECIES: transporter substrate-binding domain-containing protein [Pseudomonas]MDH0893810.1 transporter substrate-binding domain-containing protein [Pseudomonas sp. GD03875]MDH1064329.1 transporter substrate-binding domain-containing protein [Pseudomonas sp. GD03985]
MPMRMMLSLKAIGALALVALPGMTWGLGKCERLVATGNPEYPPYLWRDPQSPQHLIGANADLLALIGEQLGVKIDIIYTGPWSRAQDEVRTGRVDMLAGAFLTLPRLEIMDYVHPAFFNTPSVVWVRKGEGFPYSGWEDLRGRTGGILVNNSFGQQFDSFAKTNLDLEQVPSLVQAFQKLLLGRTDYVINERYPGMALAGTQGMVDSLETLEPPISSEGLYLTLSHDSACNDPWLRGQLAKKMTELTAAGLPETLLQRNLERWKTQQLQAADVPPQVQEKSQ